MDEQDENQILAEKKSTKLIPFEETETVPPIPKPIDSSTKRPKGRPKKTLTDEEIEFKKQIKEETEKAYKEVIENKIKSNYKRELKNKALEEGKRYKDPEPKEERPKRVLSEKQLENLAKGREIAIARTKNKKEVHKKVDEEVKTIKEAKRNIRKTLLVDRIREQIDGLDSDEDEEEIIIQKKPKARAKAKEPEPEPAPPAQPPKPTIRFF
jgi:hypothetical protein